MATGTAGNVVTATEILTQRMIDAGLVPILISFLQLGTQAPVVITKVSGAQGVSAV